MTPTATQNTWQVSDLEVKLVDKSGYDAKLPAPRGVTVVVFSGRTLVKTRMTVPTACMPTFSLDRSSQEGGSSAAGEATLVVRMEGTDSGKVRSIASA